MPSGRILGKLLLQGLAKRPGRRARSLKKAPKSGSGQAKTRSRSRPSPRRAPAPAEPGSPSRAQHPLPELVSTLLIPTSGVFHSPALAVASVPQLVPPEQGDARDTRRDPRNEGRALLTAELIRPREELAQSIEGFLLDQRSEHTRRAYGKDLNRFVKFLLRRKVDRGIEKLDRAVLIAYKDALLSEGLEHTSIDRHLATLRSFFRWLVDDGIIEKSPAEGVRFLNPRKLSSTQGFSDEEVKRLLARPNLHTRTGAQHYAILMLLFYCGLRRSELCSLRCPHLSAERGARILKLRGKGNSERILPLVPAVSRALDHYFLITRRDAARDQPLFSPIRNNRTGQIEKPLDPSHIFYIVTRYAKEAGITHRVSPHSCRATAISNARDHDVPDRVIQEFAGWSSPSMITRYDKRKSAIEKSASHAIRYGAEDRVIPKPTDS